MMLSDVTELLASQWEIQHQAATLCNCSYCITVGAMPAMDTTW